MSYRKLKADYLFDGFRMVDPSMVLICRADGRVEDVVPENQAGEGIQIVQGLLSPGFVNCHCHLELSHLKALIPEHQGLVNFVTSVVRQRGASAEAKQHAIQTAENEMYASGITVTGDICNTPDTLPAKSAKKIAYYNFIEVFGWNPAVADARFETAKQLAASFAETGDGRHMSLSPHAPYSVSDNLWALLRPGFRGRTITIHNQETEAENEFFTSGTGDLLRMYTQMGMDNSHFRVPGRQGPALYLRNLAEAAAVMLVHNTFMHAADLQFPEHTPDIVLCLCPNANLYIENKLPPVDVFRGSGARLVLGTDSLASNHQLDILEEMKTIKKHFPEIPTSEMLRWATSNGAKTLGYDDQFGDFSKGKTPGVVLVENLTAGEIHAESSSRRIL